jgi:hypothetical protein
MNAPRFALLMSATALLLAGCGSSSSKVCSRYMEFRKDEGVWPGKGMAAACETEMKALEKSHPKAFACVAERVTKKNFHWGDSWKLLDFEKVASTCAAQNGADDVAQKWLRFGIASEAGGDWADGTGTLTNLECRECGRYVTGLRVELGLVQPALMEAEIDAQHRGCIGKAEVDTAVAGFRCVRRKAKTGAQIESCLQKGTPD